MPGARTSAASSPACTKRSRANSSARSIWSAVGTDVAAKATGVRSAKVAYGTAMTAQEARAGNPGERTPVWHCVSPAGDLRRRSPAETRTVYRTPGDGFCQAGSGAQVAHRHRARGGRRRRGRGAHPGGRRARLLDDHDEPLSRAEVARAAGRASRPSWRRCTRAPASWCAAACRTFDRELQSLRGTPVVVNLWASWCGPCRFEIPFLQREFRAHGTKVAFLGVNSDDGDGNARRMVHDLPMPYPSIVDATLRTRRRASARAACRSPSSTTRTASSSTCTRARTRAPRSCPRTSRSTPPSS